MSKWIIDTNQLISDPLFDHEVIQKFYVKKVPRIIFAHLLYYNSFCDIFYIETHFDGSSLQYWYAPRIILSVVR